MYVAVSKINIKLKNKRMNKIINYYFPKYLHRINYYETMVFNFNTESVPEMSVML